MKDKIYLISASETFDDYIVGYVNSEEEAKEYIKRKKSDIIDYEWDYDLGAKVPIYDKQYYSYEEIEFIKVQMK